MGGSVIKRNDLIYPDLCYKIIGVLYTAYNELGPGYQEKYYQKAVAEFLKVNSLFFEEQVNTPLIVNGNKIGSYYLDFLIDRKIILELKRGEVFRKSNIEQVFAYLKATNLKLGIIANFTKNGLKFKRIVNLR
ncbi:GxxExxY protein [Patescibacteria group bacterium]|nr:GxxExxY protein [Patescibacteria group bacterium]